MIWAQISPEHPDAGQLCWKCVKTARNSPVLNFPDLNDCLLIFCHILCLIAAPGKFDPCKKFNSDTQGSKHGRNCWRKLALSFLIMIKYFLLWIASILLLKIENKSWGSKSFLSFHSYCQGQIDRVKFRCSFIHLYLNQNAAFWIILCSSSSINHAS